jgi:TetR/AcrR family transcriptional regulator
MRQPTARPRPERIRDASRSREAILDAAEEIFGERGFEGASLNDIATLAGLSRGTPSYFFGSKAQLYESVLERVFREREEATRQAFRPLIEWHLSNGETSLDKPLTEAVSGYMAFLMSHPSFLRLVQREELAGGERLQEVRRESRAIYEAFTALRAASKRAALQAFNVPDAVLLFVSLTFSPLAQRSTFMASLGRDFDDAKTRRNHVRLVVDQLLHFLGAQSR